MTESTSLVVAGCKNLKQGDIVSLQRLMIPGPTVGSMDEVKTLGGVAIISQTCDIVQSTKKYCLVAPVRESTSEELKNAQKGRSPLDLFLGGDDGNPRIADLEMAISIPKVWMEGLQILARVPGEASEESAREVASKIMRAYGRFPFPDEVFPALRKFREKVQHSVGRSGNFSKVLDLITDIRVSATHWNGPGRTLTLHLIVEHELLVPPEDLDENWVWNSRDVIRGRGDEVEKSLSLDRVCELILANLNSCAEARAALWRRFEEAVKQNLLNHHDDQEVFLFEAEVVSEADMTLEIYKTTESLDLEVLSHSKS